MESDTVLKFVEEPNSHLKCPICKMCYTEPVINVSCGHTFCKKCTFHLSECPLDSSACLQDKLVINRLVVGQIEELLIYCPYGLVKENDEWILDKTGCPDTFPLGSLPEHKGKCSFAKVPCINSATCGKFRQKDLNDHLTKCEQTMCTNSSKGCGYRGLPSSMEAHLTTCMFAHNRSTSELEQSNEELRTEVRALKEKVAYLETSQRDLSSQLIACLSTLNNLQQKFETFHILSDQQLIYRNRSSMTSVALSSFSSPNSSPVSRSHLENWEIPFQFKCIGTLRGHLDVVWCLTIYQGKLYSAGSDSFIKVWDLDTLAKGCIQNLQGHKRNIHCSCVGEGYLYTAGDDLSIKQWNLQKGELALTKENAHDKTICSMLTHGDLLFTSSFSSIKVWEKVTITLKHSISDLDHWVRALAFNPDKSFLYSGSHNEINFWDSQTFEPINVIKHYLGSVYSLAVTKEFVIAGGGAQANNLQIFNAQTKEAVINLEGHFGAVTSIVASPSGKFMFTGSHDHNIQLWNLETFLPLQTLSRHTGSVNTLALRGNLLLSGSEDKEIKVYRYFQSAL